MSSAESPAPDTAHQITVQPSGRSFQTPAGQAILAAAIGSGIGLLNIWAILSRIVRRASVFIP